MLAIRTILFATDFSDISEYAHQFARSLRRDYGAKLVIVHVAPSDFVYPGLIGGPDERPTRLEDLESQLGEIFEEDLMTNAEVHVKQGDPAPAILEMAEECRADLIVMGTNGRSGLSRLLLGSVAEGVMHRARCPVLTVRCPVSIAAAEGISTATREG